MLMICPAHGDLPVFAWSFDGSNSSFFILYFKLLSSGFSSAHFISLFFIVNY